MYRLAVSGGSRNRHMRTCELPDPTCLYMHFFQLGQLHAGQVLFSSLYQCCLWYGRLGEEGRSMSFGLSRVFAFFMATTMRMSCLISRVWRCRSLTPACQSHRARHTGFAAGPACRSGGPRTPARPQRRPARRQRLAALGMVRPDSPCRLLRCRPEKGLLAAAPGPPRRTRYQPCTSR